VIPPAKDWDVEVTELWTITTGMLVLAGPEGLFWPSMWILCVTTHLLLARHNEEIRQQIGSLS